MEFLVASVASMYIAEYDEYYLKWKPFFEHRFHFCSRKKIPVAVAHQGECADRK